VEKFFFKDNAKQLVAKKTSFSNGLQSYKLVKKRLTYDEVSYVTRLAFSK
jgi:hypothetical protein